MRTPDKQAKILERFIGIYCREHCGRRDALCPSCHSLLDYARQRLEKCPLDPKPACKDCPVHCYAPAQRQKIRAVMRFAGLHLAKRGRIDWLIRYFLPGLFRRSRE